jgi:hypothetical protein
MNRFSSANRAAFNPDMPSLSKEIRNHLGERLDCFLHAGPSESSPLIIIGHGVTGNKDRPFLVALAEALSENGFSALRISYAGNGASEGSFEASTISKQVEELGAVIDAVVGAFQQQRLPALATAWERPLASCVRAATREFVNLYRWPAWRTPPRLPRANSAG